MVGPRRQRSWLNVVNNAHICILATSMSLAAMLVHQVLELLTTHQVLELLTKLGLAAQQRRRSLCLLLPQALGWALYSSALAAIIYLVIQAVAGVAYW